ncbi:MAG: D-alanyl-D-alanine carboxypeptidase [Chloroflexi bacterium]|nr:D-alanyl-D-alanine carboxypeptidase [Chloroflexota bacterium]
MRLDLRPPRLAGHALALSAVSALMLASAVAVRMPHDTHAQADSLLTDTAPEPAMLPLDTTLPVDTAIPLDAAPTPQARTQGADQTQAVAVFNPRNGLPTWLHGLQDVTLYGTGDSPTPMETVPAKAAFLKPLGPFGDTRVQVYFPGDDAHPAAEAWVDATAVEPGSVPTWIAPTSAATGQLPAAPKQLGDADAPHVTARHVAVIDEASGQLIYSVLPYTEVPQASTTKMATTIVALERSPDLTRRIKVTISAMAMAARDGSSTMGIEPGETVSLDTLLHGMMLPSGNDAAEQVAVALADSREQYLDWMNQEAAALGLRDTHFVNPSGMDADGHYSSAYDNAMLARYAMRNPTFRDLAGTDQYTGDGFSMHNLNRLLNNYPGADGVKIGYTDNAQKTFVASATRDGHRVYVSLMHSQDLVGDSTALFDWVWDNFSWN